MKSNLDVIDLLIEQRCDALHYKVLDKVFGYINICKKCNFAINYEKYLNLLSSYVFYKKQIHRYQKYIRTNLITGNPPITYDTYIDYKTQLSITKQNLKSISLCTDCKKFFNPTGSKKYNNGLVRKVNLRSLTDD